MVVNLKSIESLDHGEAKIMFKTERNDFTFIIPRVHASRVCRNIVDFVFEIGQQVLTLDKRVWERTGETSLILTSTYPDGGTISLQIPEAENIKE